MPATFCLDGSWALPALYAIACQRTTPRPHSPQLMFMDICWRRLRRTEASPSSSGRSDRNVGSAGAVRYRLPEDHAAATFATTDVYGYLLATVAPDGSITFEFREVKETDVPANVVNEFSPGQVDWCFTQNKSPSALAGAVCPAGHTPTTH